MSSFAVIKARHGLNCTAREERIRARAELGVSTGLVEAIVQQWRGRTKPQPHRAASSSNTEAGMAVQVSSFLETADAIADQSVFITGFAQSGLARYCPQGRAPDGSYTAKCMMPPTCVTESTVRNLGVEITLSDNSTVHNLCIEASSVAGDIYLLTVAYATVFSILSGFILTISASSARELPTEEQPIFVSRMKRWTSFAERAGISAQISMLVALSVLGFGTSVEHAHVNIENLSIGGLALLLFLFGFCTIRSAHRSASASKTSVDEDLCNSAADVDARVDLLLGQTKPIGSQATVAAGFTFYNVVTFATDIESLANTSELRKCIFNVINVSTVAFGILAACFATGIQIAVTDLKAQRVAGNQISFDIFLHKIERVRKLVVNCFAMSLVCFIAGFGIYGLTKLAITDPKSSAEPGSNGTTPLVIQEGASTQLKETEMRAVSELRSFHESIVQLAPIICASLALLFTVMLSFWMKSMASLMVDIEQLIKLSTSADVIARHNNSRVCTALGKALAMICGCQGIDHLGRTDVARLRLKIAFQDSEDDATNPVHGEGQHEVLQAMLGAFAFRSLFFGGFAYFAIDFLFTPTWTWSPCYALAMSLSFSCAVVIITISLLYTVQSSRLQTSACRDVLATKMVYPVRIAYAMFLHSLFWQLCGFMLTGKIKDFDYSDFSQPDPAIDFQFVFDLAIPGCVCLVVAVTTRIIVTMKATELSEIENEFRPSSSEIDILDSRFSIDETLSKKENWRRMLSRMDASANAASFCAGNVFYEVLFSTIGKEGAVDFPGSNNDAMWTKLTNHWYFIFSGITFMLGTTVVIISTIVTVWIHSLETETSKRIFARKMHVLSVLCAKLFRYSQFSWLLAVAAMGVVKWSPFPPKQQFIWVSVRWVVLGVILMYYYGMKIKSIRTTIVADSGHDASLSSPAPTLNPVTR
eukprot:COSAG05_NODE_380_length_10564_cov_116.331676_3_plen_930_part_00